MRMTPKRVAAKIFVIAKNYFIACFAKIFLAFFESRNNNVGEIFSILLNTKEILLYLYKFKRHNDAYRKKYFFKTNL